MNESEKWSYGRLHAGLEANVAKIKEHNMGNLLSSSRDDSSSSSSKFRDLVCEVPSEMRGTTSEDIIHRDATITLSSTCHLLTLPPELIDHICKFMEAADIEAFAQTCRTIHNHSNKDLVFQRLIQESLPGCTITSPSPCRTYRELYYAHDPHWFIPRHKLWFSDLAFTGRLVLASYDPRRGCIEAHRIVAERALPEYETWEYDDEVLIHSFEPNVKLHLDMPVLQLNPYSRFEDVIVNPLDANVRTYRETRMTIHEGNATFSNFFLTREVSYYPGMQVWPPTVIPSSHRVRNHSQSGFHATSHKPAARREVCHHAFRIRKWFRLNGFAPLPAGFPGVTIGPGGRQMEDVQTYSTIDESLYTPTAEYPWRGIWVGDYSGHGCEFLLMHQAPHKGSIPEMYQWEGESPEDFEKRKNDARAYRGSIEAIKLTGDLNVPRGEYTFIADDIGPTGLVRIAEEARFKGCRVVRSRGHIAERFFRADKFIESQLIMISHDKLAQYWVGFGHISFYERVDINKMLKPFGNGNENTAQSRSG